MQLNLAFLTTTLEDINVGEWKCLMLTRHAELLEREEIIPQNCLLIEMLHHKPHSAVHNTIRS
jgi:hypothetical protein